LRALSSDQRFRLRLEADDLAEPRRQQRLIRRLAIDRIGADIDDRGQPLRLQNVDEKFGHGSADTQTGARSRPSRFIFRHFYFLEAFPSIIERIAVACYKRERYASRDQAIHGAVLRRGQ
jgi:hypothetical protein